MYYGQCGNGKLTKTKPEGYEPVVRSSLRADVFYFLCFTREAKEIGDVYTQARYEVAVIALVFVSVSSSVPFVHCTGPVKPAEDVSGCTVAPMAYFYIVVFQIFLKSSQ